jgi:release factor-specific protein-(glutamine-N5) methyltransferase
LTGALAVRAVQEALSAAAAALSSAGIANARAEAEWLLAGTLGVGRFDLYLVLDRELAPEMTATYERRVTRRAAGEPLQQIAGWEAFRGLRFSVTRDVLVPRPETESLVEWVLTLLPGTDATIVDVGTGSGCIAGALASERPDVRVIATELSEAAARVAQRNMRALRVERRVSIVIGDALGALRSGAVDIVVANPPYLPDAMLPTLPREVRDWEPPLALAGGPDGTSVIARLSADAQRVLRPGGWLVVETAGGAQADAVATSLQDQGYAGIGVRADLTGTRRFVAGRRQGENS